eukprot:NODE_26046_length_566_cov_10.230068.p2 GENE.NODE_26046_length_566_cov_10.230068~~NODE_26046_length_566_cov_10.230068.p2  ORF type:complete len:71 (+),score=6.51 NODE_26046_length_566_cov_10.230068:288-500(+)
MRGRDASTAGLLGIPNFLTQLEPRAAARRSPHLLGRLGAAIAMMPARFAHATPEHVSVTTCTARKVRAPA